MRFKKPLGVIGTPISHSLSPLLHNYLANEYELPFQYSAYHVDKISLEDAISGARALGFRGLNVTVPHKKNIMPFLDEIDEFALKTGAVNTVLFEDEFTTGYNTDIFGFLDSLAIESVDLSGKNVIVLGAGGAAHAIVFAAKNAGARTINIVNRTHEKAVDLAQKTGCEAINFSKFTETPTGDVVINTTSVGMYPEVTKCPVPQSVFREKCVYVDIVYNPGLTQFLKFAHDSGAKIVSGIGMLIFQGIMAMEIWSGVKIDRQKHFEPLKKLLVNAIENQ
ncbi:MAG: shikimate dehydrogenase [Calditrichaeota bacterium]|nr:MAG: shikimate dehydrogenase [Calditrichota bacterium]